MVGLSVLAVFVIPIEEHDHSGGGFCGSWKPLASGLEPEHTISAGSELGENAQIDVAAFVGAPADKAGAPLYTALEAIPGPVEFAAYISYLRQSYCYELFIAAVDSIQNR